MIVSRFKIGQKHTGKQVAPKREKRELKPGTQKTVKQLLGELYADKVYLEKLLVDDRKINSKEKHSSSHSKSFGLLFLFACCCQLRNLMEKKRRLNSV